jgi:hypothetical protein
VRHLPPVGGCVGDSVDEPPPVMWPAADSGFEADPFSPAGRAQAMWRLLDGLRRLDGRRFSRFSGPVRLMFWVLAVLVAISVLMSTVLGLARLVTG